MVLLTCWRALFHVWFLGVVHHSVHTLGIRRHGIGLVQHATIDSHTRDRDVGGVSPRGLLRRRPSVRCLQRCRVSRMPLSRHTA